MREDREIPEDEEFFHPFSISSPECFDNYEIIRNAEFLSTSLSVNLADNFLSPTGYIAFMGSKSTVVNNLQKSSPLERIGKGTVMQMALNLSVNKLREDVVYDNAIVNTIVCDGLLQDLNIKLNPGKNNKKELLDMDHLAYMLKYWTRGENRPVNGTYVELVPQGQNGEYVLPVFYN